MKYIEISGLEDDVTAYCGKGYWLCTDTLVAEGETLEECLDTASVFTQDQDGGSGPEIALADLPTSIRNHYVMLVEHYFNKGE